MSKSKKKAAQGRGSRRGEQSGQARCEPLESRRLLTGEFTDLGSLNLPGVLRASADWGDYDSDGDLDVAVTGFPDAAAVYRNDGGSFVNANAGLTAVANGSVAWGDLDKDGDLDLLVTGRTSSNVSTSKVYRNDNGSFVDIQAPLQGVRYSSVDWGDYDNDGDLDILLAGRESGTTNHLKLYRNSGGSFTDTSAVLPVLSFGDVQWGDYDGDGDLDIFATGTASGVRLTQILRNDGNAVFTNISAALPELNNSSADWGDYDNDGDLDVLLTGQAGDGQPRSGIYRNDGAGVFTNANANLTAVFYGSARWGDYDNDGDLDALVMGRTGSPTAQIANVYRNDGAAGFVNLPAIIPGGDLSTIAPGDYDNDGDLDLLQIGRDAGGNPSARILRNNATTANTAPNTPTGLTATSLSPSQLQFTWTAPTDGQTPTAGLNYNLRVGTTPGGSDVVSTMALGSGKRTIAQRGNVQGTSFVLNGLTPGQTYYWSVQAIDTALAASAFSAPSLQTLPKLDQTINFTQPTSPIQFAANQQVSLVATGGASNNPIVFSIDPSSTGAGSISGDVLTITAPGRLVINANQAGALSYNAAPQVQRTLVVRQESLVVTTIFDENDGTSDVNFGNGTSLREALDFANANPGLDTITFSPGLIAAGQAVELAFGATGAGDDTALRVASDLTIDGGGVTVSYIGTAGRRHIASFSGNTFTLRNLTLSGGNITGVNDGGALWTTGNVVIENVRFTGNKANSGGAIQNFGTVSVSNAVFESNTAAAEGGAISNSGTLTVADSLFYLNGAFNGGAINSANGLTVDRTTFSTNSASFNGGALRLFGTSTINTSTLSNNTATNGGGGLISHADTTLTNVTVAHNVAKDGGGAQLFEGSSALRHVTIAYNQATQSGGGMMVNSADATLSNTIIAGNSAGASENNLWGGPLNAASAGNVLDVTAAAAGLGALGSYDRPVHTVPLLPGSAAIDIGLNLSTITTDARGLSRLSGASPDAGAFESRPFTLSVTGGNGQTASLNPGNVGNSAFGVVTITVSSASGDPVAGGVVTLTGPGTGASISPTTLQATIGSNDIATLTPRPNGIAGTYNAVVSAAGASASPSVALTNAKTSAGVSFGNLSFTYDGTSKIPTVTTTPGGLAVQLTYTLNGFTVAAPKLAGTYRVNATIDDPSYEGSASADLVISPANVTSRFSTSGSSFRVDTRTGRALQTLTLKNTSATAIQGRLILRLAGLPSGVSVLGATQRSDGSYELSQPINLAAGASFSLNLTFLNAARQRVSYVPTLWLDGLA